MKFTMNHLQSLVAVIAMCFFFAMSFACCSKDDEPSEPDAPKTGKRMKSIDDLSFVYSADGKIANELWKGNPEYEITYHDSSIERKSINYDGSTSTIIYNLQDGLITSWEDSAQRRHYEFTYENGRLKTLKFWNKGVLDEYIVFEWKDGVIERQTVYDNPNVTEGALELFCDYKYTYTDDIDYGGAVAYFQSNSLFYDELPESLIIQGYFGKWPKYLASGAVDMTGYFKIPCSFIYALDSDGYPLVMNDSERERISFSWENIH